MSDIKYKTGDVVIISKRLTEGGRWVDMKPQRATIVQIRDTASLGPAHTLEVNGEKIRVCYWTADIDGLAKLYDNPDILWDNDVYRVWGDK